MYVNSFFQGLFRVSISSYCNSLGRLEHNYQFGCLWDAIGTISVFYICSNNDYCLTMTWVTWTLTAVWGINVSASSSAWWTVCFLSLNLIFSSSISLALFLLLAKKSFCFVQSPSIATILFSSFRASHSCTMVTIKYYYAILSKMALNITDICRANCIICLSLLPAVKIHHL